jgi:LacI family gluconate utilization system Gnt-I transcriptional repressor
LKTRVGNRRNRNALSQGKRATMRDVAKRAGVSSITVSRVLREPDKVSPLLRQRILCAVEELGYFANQVASGLASGASRVVPVLIPTLSTALFVPFLNGVRAELEPRGYEVLLGTTEYHEEIETRLVATFLGWFPAGLIVAGVDHAPVTRQRLQNVVAAGVPVVEYMETTDRPIDINVGLSHRAVGDAAARYFAAKGYHHIAYAGTLGSVDKRAARRVEGFQKALHSLCLPSHYVLLSEEPFSFFVGARVFTQLLEAYPMIEAIFFANDDMAAGALGEAQKRGIRVPQEIALMGFNDYEIASVMTPSISSINVNPLEMGRIAAKTLLNRLDGIATVAGTIDTGFQIIERETTAHHARAELLDATR